MLRCDRLYVKCSRQTSANLQVFLVLFAVFSIIVGHPRYDVAYQQEGMNHEREEAPEKPYAIGC
jgi:hypothetical protein